MDEAVERYRIQKMGRCVAKEYLLDMLCLLQSRTHFSCDYLHIPTYTYLVIAPTVYHYGWLISPWGPPQSEWLVTVKCGYGFLQWSTQLILLKAVSLLLFHVLSLDYWWSRSCSISTALTCVLCKLPFNILSSYLPAIIFSLLLN